MTSADAMRASDADRERVVQALQEAVGEGRLTLSEFEERSGTAYIAKTIGELRELTKDLPADPLAPPPTPWQQPFPMPEIPPWAQRSFPTHPDGRPMYPYGRPMPPGSRPPMRRSSSPFAIVVLALFALLVVQGGIGALALFPLMSLLFVMLMLMRSSGGGGGRRHR
jgi:Domain of unknown function (DUF1707)